MSRDLYGILSCVTVRGAEDGDKDLIKEFRRSLGFARDDNLAVMDSVTVFLRDTSGF